MDVMKIEDFGKWANKERRTQLHSRVDFAGITGYTVSNLYKIESGRIVPSFNCICNIAGALGYEVEIAVRRKDE